jgi:hypothetical protein
MHAMEPAMAPDFNRLDAVAGIRDAFNHLEAALSMARPDLCHSFATAQFYAGIVLKVNDLQSRGHRRVHGSFEITDTVIASVGAGQRLVVDIHAISSIMELDANGAIVNGSDDIVRWTQEVTGVPTTDPRDHASWLIDELGQISVVGPLDGPAYPPMDPAKVQALENERRQRKRESDEHEAALMTANVNFMSLYDIR